MRKSVEWVILGLKRTQKANDQRERKFACNLCGKKYRRSSRFERFCRQCKSEDPIYQAADENFSVLLEPYEASSPWSQATRKVLQSLSDSSLNTPQEMEC